jgi:hypothetical protein
MTSERDFLNLGFTSGIDDEDIPVGPFAFVGDEGTEPEVEPEAEVEEVPESDPDTYIVDGVVGQDMTFYAEGKPMFTIPCGVPVELTDYQLIMLKQRGKIR